MVPLLLQLLQINRAQISIINLYKVSESGTSNVFYRAYRRLLLPHLPLLASVHRVNDKPCFHDSICKHRGSATRQTGTDSMFRVNAARGALAT